MEINMTQRLVGKRYKLEEQIGQGGMGTVYRATDKLSGQPVALKQLNAYSIFMDDHPADNSTEQRLALSREFKLLASLRHPHIISVIDYGFDDAQPYFTMDLIDNPHTILSAGAKQAFDTKVNLLVQMLWAIAYLHRRGILHRDLKPANVLVDQDQVKVVDFGLSVSRDEAVSSSSGTVAYMAPEVLQQGAITERTDLYAVGIIAYELFTGERLYDDDSITTIIDAILFGIPDLSALRQDAPQLTPIVERLLAKDPAMRYGSVNEIIEALSKATGKSLDLETSATRESYLEAAQFVDRVEELEILSQALGQSRTGAGKSVLLAGESGVGKSRLLNELRIRALVDGVLVLRGQALGQGRPYQIWQDILRWLLLLVEASDFDLSVLKSIIPDVAELVDKLNIPDAPELDPQAAQERQLTIIEGLIRCITQPVVIILEDLHKAGTESITLLARLSRSIGTLPILLIGSYSDDENAHLYEKLPEMRLMKLNRLSKEDISVLSASMLGTDASTTRIVDLLQRESEGNIFFVIETVRALATESGNLDSISQMTLPTRVFAQGILSVVQRRLAKIPADTQEFLRLAAVGGRELNLTVLGKINWGHPLSDYLTQCADAAVLEVEDDRWKFSHEKFREGVIANLTQDARRSLHTRFAEALEAAYPDTTQYSTELAYHWEQAGNVPKVVTYSEAAGHLALSNGAFAEAVRFFEKVLALQPDLPGSRLAVIYRQLGDAYSSIGQLPLAQQSFGKALIALGEPDPFNALQRTPLLIKNIYLQLMNRLTSFRLGWYRKRSLERTSELVSLYRKLSIVAILNNDVMTVLHSLLSNLNRLEVFDSPADLAHAHSALCLAFSLIPLNRVAKTYYRLALENLDESQAVRSAEVLGQLALHDYCVGDFQGARDKTDRALVLANSVGAQFVGDAIHIVHAAAYFFLGDFEKNLQLYQNFTATAISAGIVLHQLWGLAGQANANLMLGETDLSIQLSEQALGMSEGISDQGFFINRNGMLALAHLRKGNAKQAVDYAKQSLKLIRKSGRPTIPSYIDGYVFSAETLFTLWDTKNFSAVSEQELIALCTEALKLFRNYSKIFALGVPYMNKYEGWNAWLMGNQSQAKDSWAEALKIFTLRGYVYEQAAIQQLLANHN